MKILFTQETDWLKRNPVQQHHLAEILSLRGHDTRVIDYELQWMAQEKRTGFRCSAEEIMRPQKKGLYAEVVQAAQPYKLSEGDRTDNSSR